MDGGYINASDSRVEAGVDGSHMAGSHHMLFEGNYSLTTDSDQPHGNAIYHTNFRNYFSGYRKLFTALDGTSIDAAAAARLAKSTVFAAVTSKSGRLDAPIGRSPRFANGLVSQPAGSLILNSFTCRPYRKLLAQSREIVDKRGVGE